MAADEQLMASLPKTFGLLAPCEMCLYQGFWCPITELPNVISLQKHFQAQDQDIIVAYVPKCGTTWLKALTFSIVNRTRYDSSTTPLLSSNPHPLVPFLELELFAKKEVPDLSAIPSPRLFSTHMPYAPLPESIKNSDASVVFICRNPFDAVVSLCHHLDKIKSNSEAQKYMEESFDMYFKGYSGFGPFWDHVLGYWKESLEKPKKVLFLKYEDLKEDIAGELKRIAEFIGYPFSEDEERQGTIQEIAKLCGLSSLKQLEVNRSGTYLEVHPNTVFFRKGNVGEWVDYISPSLKQRLENVMHEKLSGSGLSFKLS